MPSSDPVSPVPGFLVREGGAGRRRQEEKELGEGEGVQGRRGGEEEVGEQVGKDRTTESGRERLPGECWRHSF